MANKRTTRYPAELRERAVRMVQEHTLETGSQWGAITSVAVKIGCTDETLRLWIRQAERKDVRLARPMPLHWVYVTGWASADGVVQFRDDIYGRDGLTSAASAG